MRIMQLKQIKSVLYDHILSDQNLKSKNYYRYLRSNLLIANDSFIKSKHTKLVNRYRKDNKVPKKLIEDPPSPILLKKWFPKKRFEEEKKRNELKSSLANSMIEEKIELLKEAVCIDKQNLQF